jgi:hypothetical protein
MEDGALVMCLVQATFSPLRTPLTIDTTADSGR